MTNNRSNFTSKIGFILAAAGSAVGLGNIWRFPYLVAQYGGGTFLLCYIVLAVTFGFALMTAEIALGRKTRLSAIGAFSALNKKYRFIGVLAALVPILILPYYSVIGGWVIKYFTVFISGQAAQAAEDTYFSEFIGQTGQPIFWFSLFMIFTAIVVLFGVEKGIEKVSQFMMPVLVVLTIGVSLYVLTIDGAWEGVKYYIMPHMSDFSLKTLLAAMGQLFYSMSLAMGIMITYGSYMKRSTNLEHSVRQIEIFDTGIAFFAGLMIVPAVFCFLRRQSGCTQCRSGTDVHYTAESIYGDAVWIGTWNCIFYPRIFCCCNFLHLPDGNHCFDPDGLLPLESEKDSAHRFGILSSDGNPVFSWFWYMGFHPTAWNVNPRCMGFHQQ